MDYFKMRRVQCACLLSLVLCLLYSAAPVIGDTGGVEQASSEEGFSFSESSPALSDTLTAQGQSNAAKHWTAPVTRTGDYTRAYTIDLPPGRAGMTPTLGLGYQSSNRSESTAGVGWSLPRRSIRRSTSNGVPPVHRVGGEPKYDDSTTVFEIDGQVLVPLDDTEAQPFPTTSSSRFFGLQREGSVVRYEYTGLESKDCWIAHLPDGSKELYGCDTAHDRHGRVVNVQGTFEWLLLEIRDSSGNTIVYDYHFLDDPEHGQNRADLSQIQLDPVLSEVRWGGNIHVGLDSMFAARISLEKTTLDRGSHGWRIRDVDMKHGGVARVGRVHTITVGHTTGPSDSDSPLIAYWSYDFKYHTSSDTGRWLLSSIIRRAQGEPPIEMGFA